MDVRQLASLVAIADHGSFSAAARAQFTVQSNISAHVAKLERDLGATLIDRATGTLTDAGVLVVERGRRILREMAEISADISALDDVVSGETRIGVIGTTGRWLMPQFLTALREAHPKVQPIISEGGTSSLLPRLLASQIDAAIVHLPVDDKELSVTPLFAEDLVLLVHTKHPWSTFRTLPITRLGEHPLLLPPRSATLRRIINRAAEANGVTLSVRAEIDGVRLMASLAFEGFGATIVPATAIPRWLKGDFSRIEVPGLPRRVVGWVQRSRPRPGAATQVARELAESLISDRGARQPGVHVGAEAFPLKP
ncbi:MAG: LysR family transcriptional regulator [Actinobacteria bacterium]|nr:LysR family transcriptional regulator [Actinomycetota bacterium]